ncbi:hypothetical protein [Micavibrio aeruginosavorus]|uniref:Lipoprotein n=1 Tax=Micavibrio aeruginosavorus EPB TaxID=349215 RepID=M4VX02_9BACT|nr:hypothetical protein [Micavibrio aeruginosavorus]AGH97734.1 hypothetical protein A11S_912 [Micavibrio aeruginosavorus EPB]
MMKNKRLSFLVCVSVLALGGAGVMAGCTTVGPALKSPAAQFSQAQGVSATRIEVVNASNAAAYGNDVSSTFPTPLDVALRSYADKRLVAAGTEGTFIFSIEEARVTREDLQSDNKYARKLNVDNRDRYSAVIRLKLMRENPTAPGAAHTELRVQRTWTIADNLSIAEREREQNAFVEQLLRDVDAAVVNGINNTLQVGADAGSAIGGGASYNDGGYHSAPAMGAQPVPQVEASPF